MRFDKIIVIGSGKIAADCVEYLALLADRDTITVLERAGSFFSILENICIKRGLAYVKLADRSETEEYFLQKVAGNRALIISANNRFIFTPEIINQKDTEIINFHYSLLPHYRGMHIPTWVIFNKEKQTGVTWHYVTEQIDHGRIIKQKVMDIGEAETAFDITRRGMELGIEAFKEFIKDLLERTVETIDAVYSNEEPVYTSKHLPMNGVLSLDQPLEHIIRLLHSYDYKGAGIVPKLKVIYEGKTYYVEKYTERAAEGTKRGSHKMDGSMLTVCDADREVTLHCMLQKDGTSVGVSGK